MPLWAIDWWTCMQNVETLRTFGDCQQNAISRCGHMENHDIGTCEMWQRWKALESFQQMQQEGKNTIKGAIQASGHSLKLHFCMFERSQMKHNSLDCHKCF